METFWEAALSVAGIGAIASFVFWSLYKHWLSVPALEKLDSNQLYGLFKLFLVLTFLFAIVGLATYGYTKHKSAQSLGKTEPYDELVLDLVGIDQEATTKAAQFIQNTKPGQIVYISATDWWNGGPTCGDEPDCETWDIELRECDNLNTLEDIEYSERAEEIFGIAPSCRPMLMLPTKMDAGKNNVMVCRNSHRTLSGFFTIQYLGGHFGQLFYRAYEALPSPERASATLTKFGSNTCWP